MSVPLPLLKVKDRFMVKWPLALAGPPAGWWWHHWRALHSTRLTVLVQAMSRYTWQTNVIYQLSLKQTVIFFTLPLVSLWLAYFRQGSTLDSYSTYPSQNPHYKKDLVSSPVLWEADTNKPEEVPVPLPLLKVKERFVAEWLLALAGPPQVDDDIIDKHCITIDSRV